MSTPLDSSSGRSVLLLSISSFFLPSRRPLVFWFFCYTWVAVLVVTCHMKFVHLENRDRSKLGDVQISYLSDAPLNQSPQSSRVGKQARNERDDHSPSWILATEHQKDLLRVHHEFKIDKVDLHLRHEIRNSKDHDSHPTSNSRTEPQMARSTQSYSSNRNSNNIDGRVQPTVVSLSSPNEFSNHRETNTTNKQKKTVFQNELGVSKKTARSNKEIREFPPDCVPRADWHSLNFQNCNLFHEIDFASGLSEREGGERLQYLFHGGSRETWRLSGSDKTQEVRSREQSVIVKTLRWQMSYDRIQFDKQRIDALASERLTKSPYVIDIHGYCGMSALTEFAELGHFRRYLDNSKYENVTSHELLAYARDAALGLAAVHEIDGTSGDNAIPTLVHHDFSPKNLLLTADKKIKVSDFNDGKLLRWNFNRNKRCFGFNWDGRCGTTVERTNRRAPEECDGYRRYGTTERTEVYHLGSVFHFMLSKEEFPYRFKKPINGTLFQPDPKQVKELIVNGMQPPLPPHVAKSTDPSIQRIIRAMRKAFTFDMKKRPSARAIAHLLDEESNTSAAQHKLDLSTAGGR